MHGILIQATPGVRARGDCLAAVAEACAACPGVQAREAVVCCCIAVLGLKRKTRSSSTSPCFGLKRQFDSTAWPQDMLVQPSGLKSNASPSQGTQVQTSQHPLHREGPNILWDTRSHKTNHKRPRKKGGHFFTEWMRLPARPEQAASKNSELGFALLNAKDSKESLEGEAQHLEDQLSSTQKALQQAKRQATAAKKKAQQAPGKLAAMAGKEEGEGSPAPLAAGAA
eukprot:10350638-Lingulodinium_polyedra.AAC.1